MLRVIFDGPPSHDAPRFVECEDETGRSYNAGEWHEGADGLWELRIGEWREQPTPAEVQAHANSHPAGIGGLWMCTIDRHIPKVKRVWMEQGVAYTHNDEGLTLRMDREDILRRSKWRPCSSDATPVGWPDLRGATPA